MEDAREVCLLEMRDRQTSRLDSEMDEARQVRLLDLRDRHAFRYDSETDEARQDRLLDLRDRQAWRIACESEEQASTSQKYQAKLYAKRLISSIVQDFARSIVATNVPDSIVDEHSNGSMTRVVKGGKLSGNIPGNL